MRCLVLSLAVLLALPMSARSDSPEPFDLPAGFEATLFADDTLAHDIFSLTFDSRGQVVVSGPGYVRALLDCDGDGRADAARQFSDFPKSGAQGLCFDGADLWLTGDNVLARLRDVNGDGQADGPPETIARIRGGEHGGHAIVKGPDGCFYVVCGNDAGIRQDHARASSSPIHDPRCGAILRVTSGRSQSEVVAHGFRNPYDLAFTPDGRLWTIDSDGERDHHLPWYVPTRLFHVATGREHGWLAGGWMNSWSRPEWFYDNVRPAAEFGRGSPTGMVVYQHHAFPRRYHGGLFAADWTFGRVYFVPVADAVRPPELFLASRGDTGFAPVDLEVSPAGELFIAIGGRRTHGGVYRIRYIGDDAPPAQETNDAMQTVLDAPQPLASWSRAQWLPRSRALGGDKFRAAAADLDRPIAERRRAIEILVELREPVDSATRAAVIAGRSPELIARLAWAIGRTTDADDSVTTLVELTHSEHPTIVQAAWEALAGRPDLTIDSSASLGWASALAAPCRRTRWSAIQVASQSGSQNYEAWQTANPARSIEHRLANRWVELSAAPTSEAASDHCAATLLDLLDAVEPNQVDDQTLLEMMRLLQVALGDVRIERSEPGATVGYVAREVRRIEPQRRTKLGELLSRRFPTGRRETDLEIARTLAMLEFVDPELIGRLVAQCDTTTTVEDDLHYLFATSAIGGDRTAAVTLATAKALLDLHAKLAARREYPSRMWPERVSELFVGLRTRDPNLESQLIDCDRYCLPEHTLFALRVADDLKPLAARNLLAAIEQSDASGEWSADVAELTRYLPADEALPLLRTHAEDPASRERVTLELARHKRPADRPVWVVGLASLNEAVVTACATALVETGSGDPTADEVAAAIGALDRLCHVRPIKESSPTPSPWPSHEPRQALAALLSKWAGERFEIDETTAPSLAQAYEPIFAWARAKYPQSAKTVGAAGESAAELLGRLPTIPLSQGSPTAGRAVYVKQQCVRCHGEAGKSANQRLGPDLAGAADRLSAADLFAEIVDPSRTVSPTYPTTAISTRDGHVHHGLIVYESPDGTLLQTAPDTLLRVTGDQLLSLEPSDRSLMPDGLLKGLGDQEIADLYAYLRALKAPQ